MTRWSLSKLMACVIRTSQVRVRIYLTLFITSFYLVRVSFRSPTHAVSSPHKSTAYRVYTHLQIVSSFYLFIYYSLLTLSRGSTCNLSFAQLYANVLCDTRVTPATMRSQYGTRLDFNLLCNTNRDLILYQSMNAIFILFLQACFLCSYLV